jgi:probable addiction module antidote protein
MIERIPKVRQLADVAGRINIALESSDIAGVCQAIGDATRLHNVAELARKAGIDRPMIYRAFSGKISPRFATVLAILDAMGLQLRVVPRRGRHAAQRETE